MENSQEVLGHVFAALKVNEAEVAEILKSEDGLDKVKEKLDDALAATIAETKKAADGRAIKTTRYTVEKAFKDAGVDYKFDSGKSFDLNVAAGIETLQAKLAEEAPQEPTKLSDEQVLKLPVVVALKNKLTLEATQREESARQQVRDELKDREEAFSRQQTENQVRAKFQKELAVLDPIFSSDPKRAANQAKDLEDKVAKAGKWKMEGDEVYLLDEDGEIKTDKLNKPITLASYTREVTTSYYDLPVAKKKEQPGLRQENLTPPTNDYKGPKDAEEYQDQLSKLNTPQERQALTKIWEGRPQEQAA